MSLNRSEFGVRPHVFHHVDQRMPVFVHVLHGDQIKAATDMDQYVERAVTAV